MVWTVAPECTTAASGPLCAPDTYLASQTLDTELKDGRKFKLEPGMSYQVSDFGDPRIVPQAARSLSSFTNIS